LKISEYPVNFIEVLRALMKFLLTLLPF